jgi:hypothetical protein
VYRTCDWMRAGYCGITELRNWKSHQPANGYNVGMAEEPKTRVVSAETIGLIVIAAMLAIMILARWAGIIAWGAR